MATNSKRFKKFKYIKFYYCIIKFFFFFVKYGNKLKFFWSIN